jgi:hypothetical protein
MSSDCGSEGRGFEPRRSPPFFLRSYAENRKGRKSRQSSRGLLTPLLHPSEDLCVAGSLVEPDGGVSSDVLHQVGAGIRSLRDRRVVEQRPTILRVIVPLEVRRGAETSSRGWGETDHDDECRYPVAADLAEALEWRAMRTRSSESGEQ